jgi:hypothetical protein
MFIAQNLVEAGQRDLHHLGARTLHWVIDGVRAADLLIVSA